MKTLMLIRHAKSDWGAIGAADYDRALNPRGLGDAKTMGQRLKAKGQLPDLLISSTARRAQQSSELISLAMGYPSAKIQWQQALYLAPPSVILRLIGKTPANITTLALLAHNPGISELASNLVDSSIGDMPTAGVVTMTANINDWQEANTVWQLYDVDYPKRYARVDGKYE